MPREIDFEKVNKLLRCNSNGILRWRTTGEIAGYVVKKTGRIRVCIDYKKYHAADLVWLLTYGVWPTTPLDHKDTNPSNNAPHNLREASVIQQLGNRNVAKHNKLGIKGVRKARQKSGYCARIGKNGKIVHLGTFPTIEEAHTAYLLAANEHFGEFARG